MTPESAQGSVTIVALIALGALADEKRRGRKGSAVTVGVRRCQGERQALTCQARLIRDEMPADGTERLQLDVSEAVGGIGK